MGRLTEQIVREVADAEDTDPRNLPPLYEVIDPDALAALLEPRSTHSQKTACGVWFEYLGYLVTVDRTGFVCIDSGGRIPSEWRG